MDKNLKDFLLNGHKTFLPHISVDCVIFGFHEQQLKVLLLKWREGGHWCLPGGFIRHSESVDSSAKRILEERTGIRDIFLRQFHAFGEPKRDHDKFIFKQQRIAKSWFAGRFITIGYYALVEYSKVSPKPDWLSDTCLWVDVDKLPKLIYDHNLIIRSALDALRFSLNDTPVGYNLLPTKFTMPELQGLYETILGRTLDRRNFQKKMLSMDVLHRLEERKTGGAHKSPFYYKFDKKKYDKAMRQGLKFGI